MMPQRAHVFLTFVARIHAGLRTIVLLCVCSTGTTQRTTRDSKVAFLIGHFIGIWGVAFIQTKPDSPAHNCHVSDTASGATTDPGCNVKINLRFSMPTRLKMQTKQSLWAHKMFFYNEPDSISGSKPRIHP